MVWPQGIAGLIPNWTIGLAPVYYVVGSQTEIFFAWGQRVIDPGVDGCIVYISPMHPVHFYEYNDLLPLL